MVTAESGAVARRIGADIRRRMSERGMDYDQLAIQTGIGRSMLHRIATGHRTKWLEQEYMEVIAHALETTSEELLSAGYDLNDR